MEKMIITIDTKDCLKENDVLVYDEKRKCWVATRKNQFLDLLLANDNKIAEEIVGLKFEIGNLKKEIDLLKAKNDYNEGLINKEEYGNICNGK